MSNTCYVCEVPFDKEHAILHERICRNLYIRTKTKNKVQDHGEIICFGCLLTLFPEKNPTASKYCLGGHCYECHHYYCLQCQTDWDIKQRFGKIEKNCLACVYK